MQFNVKSELQVAANSTHHDGNGVEEVESWATVSVGGICRCVTFCSPTTRAVLFFPSSLVTLTPLGIDAAAILVILMELVFVARIASGRSSAAKDPKMDCLRARFSETA